MANQNRFLKYVVYLLAILLFLSACANARTRDGEAALISSESETVADTEQETERVPERDTEHNPAPVPERDPEQTPAPNPAPESVYPIGYIGIVIPEIINLRESPSTDSMILIRLFRGERLAIIDRAEDWYQVRLDDGNIGWVAANLIRIGDDAQIPPPVARANGAQSQYQYIKILPLNDKYLVEYVSTNLNTISFFRDSFVNGFIPSDDTGYFGYKQYQIIMAYEKDGSGGGCSRVIYFDPLGYRAYKGMDIGGLYEADMQMARIAHMRCIPDTIDYIPGLPDFELLYYGLLSDGGYAEGLYYHIVRRFEADPIGICDEIARFALTAQDVIIAGILSEYSISENKAALIKILNENEDANHPVLLRLKEKTKKNS